MLILFVAGHPCYMLDVGPGWLIALHDEGFHILQHVLTGHCDQKEESIKYQPPPFVLIFRRVLIFRWQRLVY